MEALFILADRGGEWQTWQENSKVSCRSRRLQGTNNVQVTAGTCRKIEDMGLLIPQILHSNLERESLFDASLILGE